MDSLKYTGCVLLADSHHGLSDGVRRLLATSFETVVMVADEGSLLEVAQRLQGDLVVIDIGLPQGSCINFLQDFRRRFEKIKIIIIGVYDAPIVAQTALSAGANGYVIKRSLATDLLNAVDAVLIGQQYISPEVLKTVERKRFDDTR